MWSDAARSTHRQRIVHHPDRHYRLSDADRESVHAGRAVFIRGGVLAASEAACRATPDEVMFYFTAREDNPELITGLVIPNQRTSAASCHARGEQLIAMARRVRAQRRVIVAASHSHGKGGRDTFAYLPLWPASTLPPPTYPGSLYEVLALSYNGVNNLGPPDATSAGQG